MGNYTRELRVNLHGADVALLHNELRQLGYAVSSEETTQRYFGEVTRKAIVEFQREHSLELTGIVDDRTVTTMRADLKTLSFRPLEQICNRLALTADNAAKLKMSIPTLQELGKIDVPQLAAKTGLSTDILAQVQALAQELQSDERVCRMECDRLNFKEVLQDLVLPATAIEELRQIGIESFAEARFRGLGHLEKIDPRLAAHARLAVLSPDRELNHKLIKVGITSIADLTPINPDVLAAQLDADPSTLHRMIHQARTLASAMSAKLLDAKLASLPVEEILESFRDLLDRLRNPAKEIDTTRSALGPVAYLVDLIQFMGDCFSPFSTLTGIENRFFRPFRNFGVSKTTVEHQVNQIEIAIEVLEAYIIAKQNQSEWSTMQGSYELLRERLYATFADAGDCPHPDILTDIADVYLRELGASWGEFSRAFTSAYPPSDRTKLERILATLGLSENELYDQLGVRRNDFQQGLSPAQIAQATAVLKPIFQQLRIPEARIPQTLRDLTNAIQQAYPHADPADLTKLLQRLQLSKEQIGLQEEQTALIRIVDALPRCLRLRKTQTSGDEGAVQAEVIIRGIKESTLADLRANLIYIALKVDSTYKNAKALGNYLHTDLSMDSSVMTTRVANVVETLQSFVTAFQMGLEKGVALQLAYADFEARWHWLRYYYLWHVAMMVFLYPENFLLPTVRSNSTPQYRQLLNALKQDNSASGAEKAMAEYQAALPSVTVKKICRLRDILCFYGCTTDTNLPMLGALDEVGEWSGWTPLESLKSGLAESLNHDFHMTSWNNQICFLRFEDRKTLKFDSFSYGNDRFELAGGDSFRFDDNQLLHGHADDLQHRLVGFIADDETLYVYCYGHLVERVSEDEIAQGQPVLSCFSIKSDGRIRCEIDRLEITLPPTSVVGILGNCHYLMLDAGTIPILLKLKQAEDLTWKPEYYDLQRLILPPNGANVDWQTKTISAIGTIRAESISLFWEMRKTYPGKVEVLDTRLMTFIPEDQGGKLAADTSLSLGEIPWRGQVGAMHWLGDQIYLLSGTGCYKLSKDAVTQWKSTNALNFAWQRENRTKLLKRPARKAGLPDFYNRYRDEQVASFQNSTLDDPSYLYLEEYYHFAPETIAYFLSQSHCFQEADDWLRLIYAPVDHGIDSEERFVYENLDGGTALDSLGRISRQWLCNPFNPYAVAHMRKGTFKRHVIFQYVGNLLDWADAEFAHDTVESVSRARELYELAETILEHESLLPTMQEDTAHSVKQLGQLISEIGKRRSAELPTYENDYWQQADISFVESLSNASGGSGVNLPSEAAVTLTALLAFKIADDGFYVPANPLLETLYWRIESNLAKIRAGRNMAGQRRQAPSYTAFSDPISVIQQVAMGEDIDESIPGEPFPIHRFSYLIERARYYTQVAQQLEALMLQAYMNFDEASYNLLKARQDLKIAQANVTLQEHKVTEAKDNYALAQQQTARTQYQEQHFQNLLEQGELSYETEAVNQLWVAHNLAVANAILGVVSSIGDIIMGAFSGAKSGGGKAGAVIGGVTGGIQGSMDIIQSSESAASLRSQARAMQASYERRAQEWKYQLWLTGLDIRIAEQGEVLAKDRQTIVSQEYVIATLQQGHAADVFDFLSTERFTNKDLWDWMGRVVKRYYREHLNFATVTARMAQQALAFERQEALAFIAPYYAEQEKRDLLAAEQLLTDINRLDQHRLTTEKRRKELTKVISLASVAPVEFQRLRNTGWMTFATLLDWFDRDFPGHYLRLIKTVSLTAVGLIPAGEAIHATFSNNGLSQVMVGPPYSTPKTIQRQPESIASTAASNGSGLFELRLDDPMLLPFEGTGVQALWTLEMPKGANHFDYSTLVDVLLTIRYTALDDPGYRSKVLKQLQSTDGQIHVQGISSVSLRTSFPDAWYHLYNPEPVVDRKATNLIEFELHHADFPPNEEVQAMLRLNLAFEQQHFVAVPIELEFWPEDKAGGPAFVYRVTTSYTWDPNKPNSGPISLLAFSHRRLASAPDNQWEAICTTLATSTLKPFGRWILRIKNEETNEPDLGWLTDALFVVTYDATVDYCYAQQI